MSVGSIPATYWLAVIAIVAGAFWLKHRHFPSIDIRTPAAHTVEVGDLLMELRANQAAAHVKYHGKVIEVSGTLRGVTMQGNAPVLTIGYLIAFNFECHLAPDKAAYAARLQPGTQMRVKGIARLSGSSVHLSPCVY